MESFTIQYLPFYTEYLNYFEIENDEVNEQGSFKKIKVYLDCAKLLKAIETIKKDEAFRHRPQSLSFIQELEKSFNTHCRSYKIEIKEVKSK
jgi:hypothetical protein